MAAAGAQRDAGRRKNWAKADGDDDDVMQGNAAAGTGDWDCTNMGWANWIVMIN